MNLPLDFLLFSLAFFLFMAAVNFVQARRKKEKFYYLGWVISSLMFVALIFLVLSQFILSFILFAIVGVVSIVAFPKTLRWWERELVKLVQEVDLSAPLKVRDFFTNQGVGWLKLASKWGVQKTICLLYLFFAVTIGGGLYTLSAFYGFPSIRFVVVYATITPILFTLMFYQQFKKALKKKAG